MRFPTRLFAAPLALAALLATARPARADASGWMFVGGGATSWKNGAGSQVDGTMAIDVGAGTTPDAPFIFGGLFRLAPIFGQGTDMAVLARGATRGFQAGDFGVAVDAGGYTRFWGNESAGFAGDVVIGMPLGLQLSIQTTIGSHDAFSLGAVAGIDLLRLTVYRQTLLDWWPNPSPPDDDHTASAGSIAF